MNTLSKVAEGLSVCGQQSGWLLSYSDRAGTRLGKNLEGTEDKAGTRHLRGKISRVHSQIKRTNHLPRLARIERANHVRRNFHGMCVRALLYDKNSIRSAGVATANLRWTCL